MTIFRHELRQGPLKPDHMGCIYRFPLRGMHLPVSGDEGGDGSGQRCFFSYWEISVLPLAWIK